MVFYSLPSGMKGTDPQAIFIPVCSSCHIDNGINNSQKELYQEVCAMFDPTAQFNSRGVFLKEMIIKGQKLIAMPGFGEHLGSDQIELLINFIEYE